MMKKAIITIAIVLGLCITTFADPNGGGLFQRGDNTREMNNRESGIMAPGLPNHGETGNQDAPLGTGIAILTAFGGAYLVAKRRKEE